MINKQLSLIRRLFICSLCLFLLVSSSLLPLRVNALTFAGFQGLNSALAWLLGSDFVSDTSGGVVSAAEELLDDVYDSNPFLFNAFVSAGSRDWFTFSEDVQLAAFTAVLKNPIVRAKLKHNTVDLQDESLTADQIPVLDESTKIYVPTDDAMLKSESITKEQVLTGFEREQLSLLGEIRSGIRMLPYSLSYELNSSFAQFQESIISVRESVINSHKYIRDVVYPTLNNNIIGIYTQLRDGIPLLNNNIINLYKTVKFNLELINLNITNEFQLLRDRSEILNNNLIATYTKLRDDVVVKLDNIASKLDHLADVITIPNTDTEVITKPQVNVQVGAQTVVVSDYATLKDAFALKMGWVPQIFDFLAELRSRLNSGTPPKVPIYLSAAEGSYKWGSDTYILDMSWYARFKPSVDTVISGIMWLCFGWALYKRIPDILSGVGLTVENATEAPGHVWSSRAERAESAKYRSDRRAAYYSRKGG